MANDREQLEKSLSLMERRLAKTRFLCSDEVSIADLSAVCELEQIRFIDHDYLSAYPLTKAWAHRMVDEDPVMLELHGPCRKYAAAAIR